MTDQSKRNLHLILLGAAHSLNHSLFVITPPLLGLIMISLDVSKTEISLISTVASFLYGAGALLGGPLGDKIGEEKTISVCLVFSGLSTFVMLAAGIAKTILMYAVGLILMSIWASLYHPSSNSLISKTSEGKVSETMGLHGVGGTLGVVLAPTIAFLIGSAYGWPIAFAAFGVLCVLLGLILLRVPTKAREKATSGGTIFSAFKIRELRILLVFNVAVGLFMKGVELFFPRFLTENRMVDAGWAAGALTLVLAVGVPAQWLGGKAADKIGSRKVLIVTSTGVCVGLLSLLLLPIYMVGIAVFIVLYGLSFYAHQPALNSLTGFCCSPNQRGAVYGIFFFTSFGIGSVSQVITGYVGDLYGLDAAFYILTAFAVTALLLSFKLPKKRQE